MSARTNNYDEMNMSELKAELRSRGMKVGGRKDELIQRLLSDDQQKPGVESDDDQAGITSDDDIGSDTEDDTSIVPTSPRATKSNRIKYLKGQRYYRLERLDREIYIILKQVAEDNGVASSVYEAFDEKLRFFFDRTVKMSIDMCNIGRVTTFTSRHFQVVIRSCFTGPLRDEIITNMTRAIALYFTATAERRWTNDKSKRKPRTYAKNKAGIHVRPSLVRTIIRSVILTGDDDREFRMSESYPISVASALETIFKHILSRAAAKARDNGKVRVTGEYIDEVIATDPDLFAFFVSYPLPIYMNMVHKLIGIAAAHQ